MKVKLILLIYYIVFVFCTPPSKHPRVNVLVNVGEKDNIVEDVSVNVMMKEFLQNQGYTIDYVLSSNDTIFTKFKYVGTLRKSAKIFLTEKVRVGIYKSDCCFLSESKIENNWVIVYSDTSEVTINTIDEYLIYEKKGK